MDPVQSFILNYQNSQGEIMQYLHDLLLTKKEFQLLEYFMQHPEQIVTSDQLLDRLWEFGAEPPSNVVAAQVCLLRRKLTKYGCDEMLETVYGLGYRFKPQA